MFIECDKDSFTNGGLEELLLVLRDSRLYGFSELPKLGPDNAVLVCLLVRNV